MHRSYYRAVVDPGVLVSALISPAGTSARIVEAWKIGSFELVVSESLLEELEEVLLRPKFRRHFSQDEALKYVNRFRHLATSFPNPNITPGLTPDPKDDYLVALARSSEAHFLVSGDPHLTGLEDPRPPVLAPRDFFKIVEDSDAP